ncbi:MAG: CotH kinase family protein [Bacteroidales bacterium]|nr:CotH kinase family protein [Bacteroidales bacterium]
MRRYLLIITIVMGIVSCEKEPFKIKDAGTLPIIKLSIDEKYLWSPDSGMYIVGENDIENPNYKHKWEFSAQIKFKENGEIQFSDTVGLRIKGNCSRGHSMKSFGVYWRKKYGKKKLQYPLFPNISTTTFKRIFLRNSGNDFGETHIKDASIMEIFKDYANVDFQAYRPCVLYLNKEYWGIYNMREMITPHHFKYHYNVDDDAVNLLEGSERNPSIDDGSKDSYMRDVVDFLTKKELSDNNNYKAFSEVIDIDSYIDYIIINTYLYKTDWPCGNAKWWNDPTSVNHKKWKWVVYDSDWTMKNIKNVDKLWLGDFYGESYNTSYNDGFFIFNHLVKNKNFRQKFLNRYLFFIETVFEKNRVRNIIIANRDQIASEYNNHKSKWNTISKTKWEKVIENMIEFNNKRNDKIKGIIQKLIHENK